MAKPNWITIISGPTGSSSGTRSLKASSNTGRSNRSGSIKGVTSGGASDSVVLSQVGASEFIMVDKTSYSVTALGGTVKITGTSNSPSLKIYQLSDPSSLSNFALKVNGTAYSWDGNSSHEISGDPGASSSYTFEISFDVAENQTEGSKDITFMLTDSGNRYPSSDEITITQAAGEKTYGTPNVDLTYYEWKIPASGGTTSPIYSFSIPWGWNGKTSGGGTLTEADTHTVTYAYADGGPAYPHVWILNPNTGKITMDSLKTHQTSGSGDVYIKIIIKINGQTLERGDYVRQQPNTATYVLSSASVSLDDIPASGGSADSPTLVSATGRIDYSSGESDTPSITSSDVIITLSKTVNGSNLGSTIKARTKLDTVTATITWNGSKVTKNIDVYQEANQVTYSDVLAKSVGVPVPKSGGDVDIVNKVGPYQKATYTSGATEDITDFSYTFTNPSWITIDELTLKATVGRNITGSTRDGEIKAGIEGKGYKSTTASIQIHQESMVLPSWSLGATETYTKDSTGITFTVSDPDNVGWEVLTTRSWMSYVSGAEKQINCSPNLTGSSRKGDVRLIVPDVSPIYVLDTCTITQESKTLPSWNVPATFRFDSIGQSDLSPTGLDLNITDQDNVGWTIECPSYVCDSFENGDQLQISGTGDKSMSLSPGNNTSFSERTFDLVLKASTGAIIATCNCTQDASAESVNTLTITHEVCGKLNVASGGITICVSPFGTLNEFEEEYIELGTTDYVNNSGLGLSVAHSVIERLSTKLNQGEWMDCNYLYFWVKNGSTKANAVPVFGSTSKTHFTNTTFVFYEYDVISSNLKNELLDFEASGNTYSIDLLEAYGVNMLSTRKMTLKGTFPVAFAQVPTGYDMEVFLRLYYNAGSEICHDPVFPVQLFDNINTSTDSNGNIIKNINFYRVIPLTQSTNYITFNGWEIFLINNNGVYNVVAKAHDGHIDLTADPISANMSFGFLVGTGPDSDTDVAGDKWLAPFDEDGDQSYKSWDFGSLNNDCTMDVSAATGKSWIALFS